MKTLAHILFAGLVGLSVTLSSVAHAQATAAARAGASELTEGEVRKVDKENRKVTLKHGEIKSLDMPAMTMAYQIADASALDKLRPGDKVRFRAVHDAGKYTVTEIQPVK